MQRSWRGVLFLWELFELGPWNFVSSLEFRKQLYTYCILYMLWFSRPRWLSWTPSDWRPGGRGFDPAGKPQHKQISCGLPFHFWVSEVASSSFEYGHVHCCKLGWKSKTKIRMTNSVDPDDGSPRAVSFGSTLCAKVYLLVCRYERVKQKSLLLKSGKHTGVKPTIHPSSHPSICIHPSDHFSSHLSLAIRPTMG